MPWTIWWSVGDFILSIVTFLITLTVVIVATNWWLAIDPEQTTQRNLYLAIAISMFGFGLASIYIAVAIAFYGEFTFNLSIISLPIRLMVLASALIKFRVMTQVGPMPKCFHTNGRLKKESEDA